MKRLTVDRIVTRRKCCTKGKESLAFLSYSTADEKKVARIGTEYGDLKKEIVESTGLLRLQLDSKPYSDEFRINKTVRCVCPPQGFFG